MAFLAAENLPYADFGSVPGRFLLSVRTKSITENFVYGKLRPLFFFEVTQRIFFLGLSANAPYDFYSGIVESFIFYSLIKSTFLVSKGLLCLYDKQNNSWLLVDMKFLFSRSTRREIPYRHTHVLFNNINWYLKIS